MYGSTISTIAVLPRAPVNGSPVPGLTSLYHKAFAGPYGDRRYPGNCSGELIKDLLRYFRPKRVLDPMTGSGTCADVCRELGIECVSFDIREGRDAADPQSYLGLGEFDFQLGLKQRDTQIIRFSHGASSSKRTYRSSFIPGLHDVCTLLEKPFPRKS